MGTEKKLDEKLSTMIDEKTKEERSVSVRKRMEDEIKKEQEDIKLDIENICNASKQLDVEIKEETDPVKIKSDNSQRRKDRKYRTSREELNSSVEEGNKSKAGKLDDDKTEK